MTKDEATAEQREVGPILADWIKLAHPAARRRSGIAFREAADIQELWRWLWANRWSAPA